MTLAQYIVLGALVALDLATVAFFAKPSVQRFLERRRSLNAPTYQVDRCGACHGSGTNIVRPGFSGHGEPCYICRGTGKVCRHPNSDSAAGPAPKGAEVGSFIGGPVW